MNPEIREGQIWTIRGCNKPVIVISKHNTCCLVDKDGRKREKFPETTIHIPEYGYICCETMMSLDINNLEKCIGEVDASLVKEIRDKAINNLTSREL